MLLGLAAPLAVLGRRKSDPLFARVLVLAGGFGFAWLVAQGLGIGLRGFTADWLTALFGPLDDRQFGMGYGALITARPSSSSRRQGLAARGAVNGDVFVVGSIGFVIAVVDCLQRFWAWPSR
jgi:iron(III) transport system permease protein